MNTKLLRDIAEVIQKKRGQFDMKWFHRIGKESKTAEALCELPKEKQIACGTTHCIAGWAQVLSPERNCHVSAEDDGARLLGLTREQAFRLFYAGMWPEQFQGTRNEWNMTPQKAAARIEHFIATGGRE